MKALFFRGGRFDGGKPSYKELEQRVKQFEKEFFEYKQDDYK